MIRLLKVFCLCAICMTMVGCVRGCKSSRTAIHINPNMDDQPRYDPQGESAFFYNGAATRMPVPGTVARGELRDDVALYTGQDDYGEFLTESPLGGSEAILARGKERFEIFCVPCHTKQGNGKGILTKRAGVPVPSFHEDRIKEQPDGQYFNTITNGKGLMQGYRWPIPAEDRWAIIAHVRELQRQADAVAATQAEN